MTDAGWAALRHDRVRNALGRVAADVEVWLARWKADGPQTSQIARCGAVLRGLIDRLGAQLAGLPPDERALAAARGIEWDLSIVEGLFRLLASRFDQRRDPALAPILAAADELIWSCLQPARALAEPLPLPLPLAYVDPAFSPSATPRIKPPPTLPPRDRLIAEMLRVLPVPLIGLPSGIVEEPWWLVLIAHEVGHHVQYDADDQAVKRTGEALREAAGDAAWEAWRQEVFADLFAVLALGPVAIEATAELEWDLPEAMAAAKTLYPPAIVRLAIMAEGARAAGYDDAPFGAERWADALAQVPAARREVVSGQLARVAAAVAAVLDLEVGRGSLRRLASGAGGAVTSGARTVEFLRRRLRGEDVALQAGRELPRSAIAEAFRAYRGLAAEPDPARRADAQRGLRDRTIALIALVRDTTAVKRAAREPTPTAAVVDRMLGVLREVEPA